MPSPSSPRSSRAAAGRHRGLVGQHRERLEVAEPVAELGRAAAGVEGEGDVRHPELEALDQQAGDGGGRAEADVGAASFEAELEAVTGPGPGGR